MASREMIERARKWLEDVHMLKGRLSARSRTEVFYPGSLAPELLRRSEEMLGETIDRVHELTAALDAALTPSEDVVGVVERLRGALLRFPGLSDDFEGLITSLSAKLAAVEGERDQAIRYGDDQRYRASNAEARASELQREVERLRKATEDALGRHQITPVHAALRAALQQEGDIDA